MHDTGQCMRMRFIIGGDAMLHVFIKLPKKYLCNCTSVVS